MACLPLALSLGSPPSVLAADPESILERMNRALAEVQFEGTLVYLHGRDLSALRVSHRVEDGSAGESLLSLTGPVRALSRHAHGVTCMLPDSAPLTVPRGGSEAGVLGQAAMDADELARHYVLKRLGAFRIAGRDTDVVGIIAKDQYRYGYRFYVDQASGLPLKVDLLDSANEPIQQIMFTDIAIDASAAPAAPRQNAKSPPPSSPVLASGGWQPTRMPPGFGVVSEDTFARNDGGTVRQLVASDGLASFSIYIEPPTAGALQGQSSLGAVSAAGGRVSGHQVTVVGEVPPATVGMVLQHVAAPKTR
jgi:sigma-E factor negative regulatory protein RseB